jgi:hypothetical protein
VYRDNPLNHGWGWPKAEATALADEKNNPIT